MTTVKSADGTPIAVEASGSGANSDRLRIGAVQDGAPPGRQWGLVIIGSGADPCLRGQPPPAAGVAPEGPLPLLAATPTLPDGAGVKAPPREGKRPGAGAGVGRGRSPMPEKATLLFAAEHAWASE